MFFALVTMRDGLKTLMACYQGHDYWLRYTRRSSKASGNVATTDKENVSIQQIRGGRWGKERRSLCSQFHRWRSPKLNSSGIVDRWNKITHHSALLKLAVIIIVSSVTTTTKRSSRILVQGSRKIGCHAHITIIDIEYRVQSWATTQAYDSWMSELKIARLMETTEECHTGYPTGGGTAMKR